MAHGSTTQRRGRPDASMSLLADLLAGRAGLGPGHVPGAGGSPGRRTGWVAGLALFAIGLLFTAATEHVRASAPAQRRGHDALVATVSARDAETDRLLRQLDRLRDETGAAQGAVLRRDGAGQALGESLDRLARQAAATPVRGPGLRVVVDDARPDPARGRDVAEAGRLLDHDLQQLANGLWAAGAEAVAVNGRRLSATTAIRSAGPAILVDYRPVLPPYEFAALGDPARLGPAFAASPAAVQFRMLRATFGIRFEVVPRRSVALPAAAALTPRHARPVRTGDDRVGTP